MEEKKDEEDRTLNEGEAEIAISHAKRLACSGLSPSFQYWNYYPICNAGSITKNVEKQ
ncbi:hypothetical protein SLEP1_g24660 [Rubroshorea leprosula]|uniref:Uncharacterized protein n=1 Tax=Rubroshorea leprosula TaxID=152421 RepID=A0AAV5JGB3_9ROSI|nr:hypothetical protein SLEP1_g24660 [Rubroshorea leprosula]